MCERETRGEDVALLGEWVAAVYACYMLQGWVAPEEVMERLGMHSRRGYYVEMGESMRIYLRWQRLLGLS